MTNKQWYTVFVTTKHGMARYALEHYITDIESLDQYNRWFNELSKYFRERTGIKGGQIVAIEPSEIVSAYEFRKEDGYQG